MDNRLQDLVLALDLALDRIEDFAGVTDPKLEDILTKAFEDIENNYEELRDYGISTNMLDVSNHIRTN